MPPLKLLRLYAPDVTVGFVRTDSDDEYYGEYDPETGFTFTELFLGQDDVRQKYIVLHEVAHYLTENRTKGRHNDIFYRSLTKLVKRHRIPFSVAREIEGMYPEEWLEEAA